MTETMTIVERARNYLALNAAESGADVLIDELAAEIERLQTRVAELETKLSVARTVAIEESAGEIENWIAIVRSNGLVHSDFAIRNLAQAARRVRLLDGASKS